MAQQKRNWLITLIHPLKRYWQHSIQHKVLAILLAVLILFTSVNYAVAQWYIAHHADEPLVYGTTFVPNYARYFGLDPKETLSAIFNDLGIKRVRLVSYWSDIERDPDSYNFDELDWQMRLAEEKGVKVSLAIGLRQPRWPECHAPDWAKRLAKDEWYPQLKEVMAMVIERYKNSPALESYQLENEYFLTVFGLCWDFDRERLVDEYNFVGQLDPGHPIIVSRSNNWVGIPIGEPTPDKFGISVYKRVWDKTITKRYYEYPLPAWFYAMLAGWGEIFTGRDMIIHELQAEPWMPEGFELKTSSLEEQDKSMNAKWLEDRLSYARGTGMRTIDLWGAEWWYWRKVKHNDPSLWNTVKKEIEKVNN